MAYKSYLSIPNIPGESADKGFLNQIDTFSFSLGASNPTTFSGAGKASFSDVNFLKPYDRSSPPLLRALALGTNVAPRTGPGMILTLVNVAVGGTPTFLTYTFQDVYVSSVQDSGSSGGDSVPLQSLSFAFGIITEVYHVQNTNGTLGPPVSVSYNIETNTIH